MRAYFICSLTLFSLFTGSSDAQEAAVRSASIKKPRAHFVGSKRPQQNEREEKRPSSRIKNEWVVSKTHPKSERKQEGVSLLTAPLVAGTPPNIFAAQETNETGRLSALERKVGALQAQVNAIDHPDDRSYPRTGVYAPRGGVYFTGEWLFWQTREGGLEFAVERASSSPGVFTDAVPTKLEFDWESGFRVGLGVHLPHDGWDIYASYTDFQPASSKNANGSVFPLLAFQGQVSLDNVTRAHAHRKIHFQAADLEIGRAFYLAKTLALRPFFGCKGAWIDQHSRVTYTGGDLSSGEQFKVRQHNDFKGAGLRVGLGSNWEWCAGWSFVGNLSGSLLVGHFDLSQDQTLPTGVKTIDLDSDFNLINPQAQLSLGIAWDRNFCRDRCHFGISANFETQYFWGQNQSEWFTDTAAPVYVRPVNDLSFYGISLMARLDF